MTVALSTFPELVVHLGVPSGRRHNRRPLITAHAFPAFRIVGFPHRRTTPRRATRRSCPPWKIPVFFPEPGKRQRRSAKNAIINAQRDAHSIARARARRMRASPSSCLSVKKKKKNRSQFIFWVSEVAAPEAQCPDGAAQQQVIFSLRSILYSIISYLLRFNDSAGNIHRGSR